jgi:transcriptional activator of cad operon
MTELPDVFRLGPWRVLVDQDRLERVTADGVIIEKIEPKAMDVLRLLASRATRTVTRDELFAQVWNNRPVVESALSRVILALRSILGDDARAPIYIETITRRGYRLLVCPKPDSPSRHRFGSGGTETAGQSLQ